MWGGEGWGSECGEVRGGESECGEVSSVVLVNHNQKYYNFW